VSRSRKSLDEQLAELTKRKDQLEARRLALLAVKKSSDRKLDTRRKIVVGAAVLAHAELNPSFADQLREILDPAVQRPVDRGVIEDLLPSPAEAAAIGGAAEAAPPGFTPPAIAPASPMARSG